MGFTFFIYMLLFVIIILRCRSSIVINTFKIMENIELLDYEAPQIEVVKVEVEKGFANSDVINMPGGDV